MPVRTAKPINSKDKSTNLETHKLPNLGTFQSSIPSILRVFQKNTFLMLMIDGRKLKKNIHVFKTCWTHLNICQVYLFAGLVIGVPSNIFHPLPCPCTPGPHDIPAAFRCPSDSTSQVLSDRSDMTTQPFEARPSGCQDSIIKSLREKVDWIISYGHFTVNFVYFCSALLNVNFGRLAVLLCFDGLGGF